MRFPRFWNWQALTLTPGLLFIAVLLLTDQLAYGIEGFDKFRKFKHIYEPSGIVQLADERFVVVEDEAASPVGIFTLDNEGETQETYLARASLFSLISSDRALNTLDDLEGVTTDSEGRIYAITSHSRKNDGKRRDSREQLVRFRLQDDGITDFKAIHGLRKRIARHHDLLKDAARLRDVKDDQGFNIEALSFDSSGRKLLIGMRGPLADKHAVIVTLENPHAVFDSEAKPEISQQLITLDLDGGGIRAMCYDPTINGYLIIARKQGKDFKLWLWSGDPGSSPTRVKIKGTKNLRQAEGITPVIIDGKPAGILIVSDEGDSNSGTPGRYLFVSYEQLEFR